ncbi:MAG: GDP-mannose 4,6-dehydratase [Acidobacteria bacterium]|nr:GDP-mannose 4,6-dehydratase [Acidobacteriota bacterium]
MFENRNRRVLITGITGCVGQHLASHLVSNKFEIYGFQRQAPADGQIVDKNHIFQGDLLDGQALCDALQEARPTQVYHLAGAIDRDVHEGLVNYETNVIGTIRLLNAIKTVGITPRILIVSSSAVYGGAIKQPINETAEFLPLTHYAVSKVTQEMVALQYHITYKLPIIRVRNFNVSGPGLSPSLLCSDLARQIAMAEQTGAPTIRVGNTQPQRDYTDVRDIVRAYELLMQAGNPGEVYNVCSMNAHSVKECVEILVAKARIPLAVEIDQSRYRAAEIEIQVGDSSKIQNLVSWKPNISFAQSLEDLLNYWRGKLQGEVG